MSVKNRVSLICRICQSSYEVPLYRQYTSRTCGLDACRRAWCSAKLQGNQFRKGLRPRNSFAPGHNPWNKYLKGIHLSPSTEFIKGRIAPEQMPIGSITVRTHRGVKRAWIKIGDPNCWRLRAVVVWELAHGPVPRGYLVHHKNRQTLEDGLENLELLSRASHLSEHRPEFEALVNDE